jgi:iron(III) transport system substrate-binding protein
VALLVASFGCTPAGRTSTWSAAETAPQSGQVVVYTSVDDVFARPICERFERETGIQVQLVPNTEETKSAGLLNRLIAEKQRPQCDVFWSGDPIRAAVLKSKGISAPYHSPQAADLPKLYSDPAGHWTGFSCRARVIICNRNLVPQGQEPPSVMDLLDPRFRGQACMANPLFGTTSMHAAALFAELGDDEAKKFFDGFAANGGKILSSNGEVRRRVAAGEFAVGLTDTDDYNVARQEDKPVGVVFPDRDGMGTLIVPNCAVLIAGGPDPENGQRSGPPSSKPPSSKRWPPTRPSSDR